MKLFLQRLVALPKRAWEWLTGLFTPIIVDADTPPAIERVKRKYTKRPDYGMKELLGNLDETFKALRLPHAKWSWVHKDYTAALRTLGVHVVHNPAGVWQKDLYTVEAGKKLPAMLCVSFGLSRFDSDDTVYPAVFFAVKEKKLPHWVDKCKGQHYVFGWASCVGKRDVMDKDNQELAWVYGYITVRPDGTLYVHKENKMAHYVIPKKHRNGGGVVHRREWNIPAIMEMYEDIDGTMWKIEQSFANAMMWWLRRKDNWSVAVKKNGERITFSIPKEQTKVFFRDRIKVQTANGSTKRIVHYVREHERTRNGKTTLIKEHIRGLSYFDWNTYHVEVTAPSFNGELSVKFDVAAEVFDEDAVPANTVDMKRVAEMLVQLETPRTLH